MVRFKLRQCFNARKQANAGILVHRQSHFTDQGFGGRVDASINRKKKSAERVRSKVGVLLMYGTHGPISALHPPCVNYCLVKVTTANHTQTLQSPRSEIRSTLQLHFSPKPECLPITVDRLLTAVSALAICPHLLGFCPSHQVADCNNGTSITTSCGKFSQR